MTSSKSSSGTMLAVVKDRAESGVSLRDVKIPAPSPGEVLLRVLGASICGTDLHIFAWDDWASSRMSLPIIIGHEFAGEVVELGTGVDRLKIGDTVAGESHIVCGACSQCASNRQHLCLNLKLLGVHVNGALAEYVVLPEKNAWKTPASMPIDVAAIQEPFGNAVHATLSGPVRDQKIGVVGCGPIGLFSIAVARAEQARTLVAIDVNNYRLNLAKKIGANHLVNAAESDVVKTIMEITAGEGLDMILEMSGNSSALSQAFKYLRNGGRLCLFGIPSKPVTLNLVDDIIFKEAQVHGIFGREMWATWEKATELFLNGRVDISPLITHRMKMLDFNRAVDLIKSGECGKVIMYP